MQFVINGLVAAASTAFIAVTFSLVFSTGRFFHLAYAGIYTAAGYFVYALAVKSNWSLPFAVATAAALCAAFGGLMDFAVYRPLRRRGASANVLLLASLGLLAIIDAVLSISFGDQIKYIRIENSAEGFAVFGGRITPREVLIIGLTVALLVVLALVVRFSSLGRTMRAVASDPELSTVVGIDVDRVVSLVFIAVSGISAIGAFGVAYDRGVTLQMGFDLLLPAIVAVVIGGIGQPWGAAFGALVVAFVEQTVLRWTSTQWQQPAVFVILIGFLIFKPQGIFGRPQRRVTV